MDVWHDVLKSANLPIDRSNVLVTVHRKNAMSISSGINIPVGIELSDKRRRTRLFYECRGRCQKSDAV